MPTVIRRNNSKYWTAVFRDGSGRQIWKTTKCDNRTDAMTAAIGFEKAARAAHSGVLFESNAREYLNSLLKMANAGEIKTATVDQFLTDWIEHQTEHVGPSTISLYRRVRDRFLKALPHLKGHPIAKVTGSDIQKFVNVRLKSVSQQTANHERKMLSMAFGAAVAERILPYNPCALARVGSKTKGIQKTFERGVFATEEIKRILQAADNDWKPFLLFALATGQRQADVQNAKWEDIDLKAGTWKLTQRKGNHPIQIPLHARLIEMLSAMPLPHTGYVFVRLQPLPQGGHRGLCEKFKAICRAAKVDVKPVTTPSGKIYASRSFHSLRHTHVSMLTNKGVAAEVRQRITGHRDAEEHQRYSHHEIENLRSAVNLLPFAEITE